MDKIKSTIQTQLHTLLQALTEKEKEIDELNKKYQLEMQYLKDVINNLPGSIYWKNTEGTYLGHNKFAVEKMNSVSLSNSIIGKTDYHLFDKEIADKFRQHDLMVMQNDEMLSLEEETTAHNGERIVQLSIKKPVHDAMGNVIGIVGNTVDITELKNIQDELVVAKEKAEASSVAKTEFIRNLEHDIRTPFAGIYSLVSILAKQEIDAEKRRFLMLIEKSAKELLDYFNGIIRSLATLEKAVELKSEKINLPEVIQGVINMETPPAVHKKLQLIVDYPENVPKYFITDSGRINRILINLISNAIKFTHSGYVKVAVELQAGSGSSSNVVTLIKIIDTGIGIPEEKQEAVYHRFLQLTPSNHNIYKGTGLGLSVVKALIEELNGKITLESVVHKGTTFTCYIPMQIIEEGANEK